MGLSDRIAEKIYRIAMTRNKLKIIMTPVGIIFWVSLLVLFIYASLWLDRFLPVTVLLPRPINMLLSGLLLVMAAVITLWPVYRFFRVRGSPVPINPPQELVTTGMYARVRNPMVLGWIILMFGLGLLLNSISLMFIFTPFFLIINILYLKTIEEKELEKKFGQQYVKYKKAVPMFFPRFSNKGFKEKKY